MSGSDNSSMASIVNSLVAVGRELSYHPHNLNECKQELPSRTGCHHIMQQLRSIFFPGYFHLSEFSDEGIGFHVGAILDLAAINLREQIKRGFCFDCDAKGAENACSERAESLTRRFLERLPEVMQLLGEDVQAAYEGDPAAKSPGETILCYPGVYAITNHRVAHEL